MLSFCILPTLFFSLTSRTQAQVTVRQLATFQNFAENIAVRSNGDILVTSLTTPSVLYLNPKNPNVTIALPAIAGAGGISGITEVSKDVFAVNAAIWNLTARRSEQTAIWTLDFRRTSAAEPVLKKIVDVPETTALNGLTTIPGTSTVLASDSAAGVVYRIDIAKQTYSIAIQDEAFAPTGSATSLGINGVRVHGKDLYFSNSATGYFGRIPISRTGAATGPAQFISRLNATETNGVDDFVVDNEGTAWVTLHPAELVKIPPNGRQDIIAQGIEVDNPTSIVFARGGRKKQKSFYATINHIGEEIVGGVVAIDVGNSYV